MGSRSFPSSELSRALVPTQAGSDHGVVINAGSGRDGTSDELRKMATLAGGVYVLRLEAGETVRTQKLTGVR